MSKGKIVRNISAKTGQYVTKNYAAKHPSTTIKQTIKKSKS